MNDLFDTVVLIPSLHPDHLLSEYADQLIQTGFHRIVIVDDGSGEDRQYQDVFERLNSLPECTVIGYSENHGKGYALKYGMQYIAQTFPDAPGIVTADSDGQHTASDVLKLANRLQENDNALLLGSRDFSQENVPLKSRFGNRMTSFFYLLLYGQWLPDTQTGLRAFSSKLIPFMCAVPGDRFEYEMNVLIYCSRDKIPFDIVGIDTIYIAENKSTHFRAFHDSMRIYSQLFGNFFRYASSSILSFLLDLFLFTLLDKWLLSLLFGDLLKTADVHEYLHTYVAVGIARLVSSVFNYRLNKQFVFEVKECKGAAVRYATLCVMTFLLSAGATNLFHLLLNWERTPVKIVVDTVLYFVNYRIQRSWVFHDHTHKEALQ